MNLRDYREFQSAPVNTTFVEEKTFRVIKSRTGYEISGYNDNPSNSRS